MLKLPRDKRPLIYLTLAGLASALFVVALQPFLSLAWLPLRTRDAITYQGLGAVYGLAISAYFILRERQRSPPWRVLLFVLTCFCAYLAALFASVGLYQIDPWIQPSGMGSKLDVPLPIFFVGCFLGSFLILFASLFLFGPSSSEWRVLKLALAGAIAGGFLGMAGWGLGEAIGSATNQQIEFFSLYLVWQPGVALTLAVLLSVPEPPSRAAGVTTLRTTRYRVVPALLFFGSIGAFLLWYVSRTRSAHRKSAQLNKVFEECRSKAPPIPDRPSFDPMTIEQALILEPIGDFAPQNHSMNRATATASAGASPPSVYFSVSYFLARDPRPMSGSPMISVTVQQLPNAAWAGYSAQYPACNLYMMGSRRESSTKFGNQIFTSTDLRNDVSGTLIFLWPALISSRSASTTSALWKVLRKTNS